MIHRFNPEKYYNVFGGQRPILRITPGDTLVVPTLDAHGFDHKNDQPASSPNPVTGPVYIKGAQPKDALAVEIRRITLTRDSGWSSTILANTSIDPSYARCLPAKEYAQWRIDTGAGTATVIEPDNHRGRIVIPLSPMIGCLGVSPADGQVLSTRTAGSHGGNMDYCDASEGCTLYFPVFETGALFYIGDVHAAQGDAETAGTGIETTAQVELGFSLRKKYHLSWPRGENNEHIFTIGNARPLEQALQHATTEMHRWLCEGYGYDAVSASLLIGQAALYNIANCFNPVYTISCRIPKKLLGKGSE